MSKPGMWVALKRCGCCVGAAVDRHGTDNDWEFLAWLKSGLRVQLATWDEWRCEHLPGFLECPHEPAQSVAAVDPQACSTGTLTTRDPNPPPHQARPDDRDPPSRAAQQEKP